MEQKRSRKLFFPLPILLWGKHTLSLWTGWCIVSSYTSWSQLFYVLIPLMTLGKHSAIQSTSAKNEGNRLLGCFWGTTFLLIVELSPLRLSDTVAGTRNEVNTGPEKEKCGTASGTSLLQFVAHWPRKDYYTFFFLFYSNWF